MRRVGSGGKEGPTAEHNVGSKKRFGVFEFDPQARELTKHGVRLKLQEQPMQILAALLEQVGQIVPREDLQRRLWPDGTFVDYEQSLNKAVNKLREALGDSADRPIYIETLARRGYRFVAPVEGNRTMMPAAKTAAPRPPGSWYANKQEEMRADPVLKMLHDKRNTSLHVEPFDFYFNQGFKFPKRYGQ
jgi:DNA-binding winged helix-turn-helix (wHTH) protein